MSLISFVFGIKVVHSFEYSSRYSMEFKNVFPKKKIYIYNILPLSSIKTLGLFFNVTFNEIKSLKFEFFD